MPSNLAADRRWYALAVLCIASFVVILDASIVLVAMPSIARELDFSTSGIQWVLSGYGLTFGGLLFLGGRCSDILGRRRTFMAGITLFVVASLCCAIAWDPGVLVAARIAQGVSAAIMSPSALSLLSTTFQEGTERNRALAVWGATAGLGGTAGPLVGGPITSGLGWEWVFLINIPLGLALLVVTPMVLEESHGTSGKRVFDAQGALTITAALAMATYAVVDVPNAGWLSVQTITLLTAATVLFALFIFIERRVERPLLPLRIFQSRTLVGGNLVLAFFGMTAYGIPFILTEYAQQILHYSPMQFGLMTAVMALAAVAGNFGSQPIIARYGPAPVAIASVTLAVAGSLLLTTIRPDGNYLGDIFWGLLLFGPALGAGFVAGSIASLNGVDEGESGLAAGLNNTSFQIGGTLGIAIMTTVAMSRAMDFAAGTDRTVNDPVTLTQGYQSAYVAAAAFAVIGLLGATLMLPVHTRLSNRTARKVAAAAESS